MRITLIAAQSLDGFITRHDQPGSAFASSDDRKFFREALQDFDCCVMGATTYREARTAIQCSLMPERLRTVITHKPEEFVGDVVPGKLEFTRLQPVPLAAGLASRGYAACALLGGSQIHSLFFEAGLVDELWLTVEPLLFGEGTPLLARRTSIAMELISTENLNRNTLLLKYRVIK